MKPQWKKFTGSKEQIEEMRNAKDGWVCRNSFEDDGCIYHGNPEDYEINLEEYLICQKHPHAEMIKHHAMTGRPVYFKDHDNEWIELEDDGCGISWHPDDEFTFNPPQEEEKEFIEVREYLCKGLHNGRTYAEIVTKPNTIGDEDIIIKVAESYNHFIKWIDKDWRKVYL